MEPVTRKEQILCSKSLLPSPFEQLFFVKYPISVAKMCFFDLLGRQTTRSSGVPLGQGCSGPWRQEGTPSSWSFSGRDLGPWCSHESGAVGA